MLLRHNANSDKNRSSVLRIARGDHKKTHTGNRVIKKQMVLFLDSGDHPISTLEPADRSPRQAV